MKKKNDWLLWLIAVVFIAASVVGMVVFDIYGEAHMGDYRKIPDAAAP